VQRAGRTNRKGYAGPADKANHPSKIIVFPYPNPEANSPATCTLLAGLGILSPGIFVGGPDETGAAARGSSL